MTDSETESADQSTTFGEEAVKGRFSTSMKGKIKSPVFWAPDVSEISSALRYLRELSVKHITKKVTKFHDKGNTNYKLESMLFFLFIKPCKIYHDIIAFRINLCEVKGK